MQTCEEAIEFASPEFSRCLLGNPDIWGYSLFVDGHLVDEVDKTFLIKDERDVFNLVIELDGWLMQHGKGMFSAYPTPFPGLVNYSTSIMMMLLQESIDKARQLLVEFNNIPMVVAKVIQSARDGNGHPLDNTLLNLEAAWLTLTAVFY